MKLCSLVGSTFNQNYAFNIEQIEANDDILYTEYEPSTKKLVH